jgi:membrane protein
LGYAPCEATASCVPGNEDVKHGKGSKAMAMNNQIPPIKADRSKSTGVLGVAGKSFQSFQAFWAKINNDWIFNFASGLAYTLIVALIPIIIAIIALAGLIYGGLDPAVQAGIIKFIQNAFPPPIPSEEIVSLALDALNKSAGILGAIAIVIAVIGGSGLFLTMEGYFAIIYRTRTRSLIPQYVMAISMILLFVLLMPLIIFADSLPSLLNSLLKTTPISQIPGYSSFVGLGSIIAGLFITWGLIEIIYLVVPNKHISFRNSWFGALLAAVAIQAYLLLFPVYVTHFLSGYSGTIGFTLIFLFFFYYFALILLIGAEINAFFGEGIPPTAANLAGIVQDHASQPPTTNSGPVNNTEN